MNEVEWTLRKLTSVVDSVALDYSLRDDSPVEVIRVNRDDGTVFDYDDVIDEWDPIQKRKEDLQRGVFIGARTSTRSPTPVGTEYDHRIEAVVDVRVEGLTTYGGNWGHVDPKGDDGVPFDELVRRVRRTILDQSRSYPDMDVPDTTYHDITLTQDNNNSAEHRDFYQWSGDFAFRGYETLPEL